MMIFYRLQFVMLLATVYGINFWYIRKYTEKSVRNPDVLDRIVLPALVALAVFIFECIILVVLIGIVTFITVGSI